MANHRQSLNLHSLTSGVVIAGLLILLSLSVALSILRYSCLTEIKTLWQDQYLWHVIRFTFWQALLSTLLSILPAIFVARALYRRQFLGKQLFLRLCAMTLVLPVLVAVFGILSVYGREGWLSQLFSILGMKYTFSPYGLTGILLGHIFFNLPLATLLLLQALKNIPIEQKKLSAQLGMNGFQHFRWVEWPYLRRQILPTGALIFMLCFASFAIVLSLGGGPKATTIELAIYQALHYDYNLNRAALLSLIQMVFCLGLFFLSEKLNGVLAVNNHYEYLWIQSKNNLCELIVDILIISGVLLLLLPPLLSVIINGCHHGLLQALKQDALWQATFTSLKVSISSGILCLILTIMLLWSHRELKTHGFTGYANILTMSGMLILVIPSIVLATGIFLLLQDNTGLPESPYGLIILTNALMAMPYTLKVLENPMQDLAERYHQLCLSLNVIGMRRLRWIELLALKHPLAQSLAFACVLSMGDFGIVAVFGGGNSPNNDEPFRTLPFYLYQQIGAYRINDAAVTALLLLLLCFFIFIFIEKLPGRHVNS
ncbi:thiamine/thiamine pyrophosphate ABC transporter permease ThiP [Candidatus Williamhamiltonella defendens]|uniref:Thiamine transport system permease protein ThiP n=1 Tax=Candidatus Williamhamiltonella defendens TaxID=138072 RepID=A0A2D3TFV6_9ENTR|nr:thiamine/thiamine pyrophosphate ABC transporter permease ThiP [Candidatus Hamiltonella defensa]ATW34689.1 thiamine/thiamine pyrophosphate ABC transporter permease ThiP [Candidatus Hamiltonella defensa]